MLPEGTGEWREEIARIADSWLFADVPANGCPDTIILPLENPDLHDGSKYLENLVVKERYRLLTSGTIGGRNVGVVTSKFGSPAVAMTIELLAKRRVQTLIGVGFCGAIDHRIQCGDLIVPYAAVRDEGTSKRYVEDCYPACAEPAIVDRLVRAANHCYTGLVWTTDAPLLESTKAVQKWSRLGVLGVDMEVSALFTVSRLFGIKSAAILVASDNALLCRRAEPNSLEQGHRAAVTVALKCVSELDAPKENV